MINQQNKSVNQQGNNKMIDQKLNQIIIEDIVEYHVNQENAENQFQENFTSQECESAVQLRNVVFGYRRAIFFSLILNDININVKQGQSMLCWDHQVVERQRC